MILVEDNIVPDAVVVKDKLMLTLIVHHSKPFLQKDACDERLEKLDRYL